MSKTIAVYGGSFNPPGLHHRRIVEDVASHFDNVVIVPCGPRPDKPSNDHLDPVHRAAMADINFQGIANAEVDLFDLELATFTRTHLLQERYAPRGEVWHLVGADLVAGGAKGEAFIQKHWENGKDLWRNFNFAVINRRGFDITPDDLPPKHKLIKIDLPGSDNTLREMIYYGQDIKHLLVPRVAQYIERYQLYSGRAVGRAVRTNLPEPKLMVFADERNPKARAWKAELEPFVVADNPNCIIVIGGDGTMLHAIQTHWRLRVPFFGINAGHLGFLLNNADEVMGGKFPPQQMVLRHMPLLYVEMQDMKGDWRGRLTFNDAWVQRSSGQSAWFKVKLNGQTRIEKLVCDGVLVSTAAGSTAYARSMGAPPLLADTPAWLLVGSNVMTPPKWKSALLSTDAFVEITGMNTEKRPLDGYMYGQSIGPIQAMKARLSRIAAVELAFCAHHDMAEKIARVQFGTI